MIDAMVSLRRHAASVWAVVALAVPSIAMAQEPSRIYLVSGWGLTEREALAAPSTSVEATGVRSLIHVVTVGAGVRLYRGIGLDGTVELHSGQDFAWKFRYVSANQTNELATDRDMPFLATLRLTPAVCEVLCPQVFIGGGYDLHRVTSVTTEDCGSGSQPVTTCRPLDEPRVSDRTTRGSPALSAGVGVAVRVSPFVTLTAGLRILAMKRQLFATHYIHRGPHNTSGQLVGAGVTALWSWRR